MKEIPEARFLKKNRSGAGLEVIGLSDLFRRQKGIPHRVDRPHRLDFFSVILFTKGTGSHFIDFRSLPFSRGTVLFTAKGQVHAFGAGAGTEGVQILIDGGFLKRHGIRTPAIPLAASRESDGRTPVIRPGDAFHEDIPPLIAAIGREYRRDEDPFREKILACLVEQLFLSIERARAVRGTTASGSRGAIFAGFENLLAKNIRASRNARDYAERLGVSYKHLNEVCKESAGLTAKECIDRELILEIERRLAVLDLSTKEISEQTGFDEPTNFVKYFKARTGFTPTQFRENIR